MKIKEVCELTGLTARTIRVYIDEQLIDPEYTENYLGRRSFEFSSDDVDSLINIAILRKYGFSIDEIRNILLDSQNSIAIIERVKLRTQKLTDEYRARLSALCYVEENRAYSVSELSKVLSKSEAELTLPVDMPQINIGRIIISILSFTVVILPFILVAGGFIVNATYYTYPKFRMVCIVLSLCTLIPSICVLAIKRTKNSAKRFIKPLLICLCIIALPFSLILPYGIVAYSETTDIRNYRDFDPECLATRITFFDEVLPIWPHYFENVKNEDGEWEAVYLESKYYYRFLQSMDYTYDVYAEWPLKEDEFIAEVERVRKIFEEHEYIELRKGDFCCFVWSDGISEPFREVTDNYTHLIFAYNKKTHTVRYILSVSLENGADQPYYLQLDW